VKLGRSGDNARMLIVIEALVSPGYDPDKIITEETRRDTQAQVMTIPEAEKIGFTGLRPDPQGRETRLVVIAPRDSQRIQRQLEANEAVSSFRVHEVDM
jgi:hypothetical protein